jgi:hypothetical protein
MWDHLRNIFSFGPSRRISWFISFCALILAAVVWLKSHGIVEVGLVTGLWNICRQFCLLSSLTVSEYINEVNEGLTFHTQSNPGCV